MMSTPLQAQQSLSIQWQQVGELAATPDASTAALGVSAAYSGMIGPYLVVAGGANFPKGHPHFDQAQKVFYDQVWVFDSRTTPLQLVGQTRLPAAAAYGATVRDGQSLLLVGGQNQQGALNSVNRLRLDGTTPIIETLGRLPFGWSLGGVAWWQQQLYLFGGEVDGQTQANVYQWQMGSGKCEIVAKIPGPGRSQFPFAQTNGKLHVFGGISAEPGKAARVLTDSYSFDLSTKRWLRNADILSHQHPNSVAGGAAVALDDQHILLLGGVDLAVFNEASSQLHQLKGDSLKLFKDRYFRLTPAQIGFSRQQLMFEPATNRWTTLADPVPFLGGAGPLSLAISGEHVYWIGGEIKPVTRRKEIYRGQWQWLSSDTSMTVPAQAFAE